MRTWTSRAVLLALIAVAALVSGAAVIGASLGDEAAAHADRADHAKAAAQHHAHRKHTPRISAQELQLRQEMRRLWEDHVTWTRLAVISLTTDAPDTEATVGRLLRNQDDIGAAIVPFFGEAAGAALSGLLREHILIAAGLIAAARSGDEAALAAEQARWEANADEIAAFLSAANPRTWKLGEMKAMMRDHLRLTTDEVVARLQGDWEADVRAYDAIHLQALHMADMLSDGLVAQFPRRFR